MKIASHGPALAVLGFACALSTPAKADPDDPAKADSDKKLSAAVDIDYAIALGEGDTDNGAGGALRLGYDLSLLATSLTPEIGLAYHGFDGSASPRVYRAFAGARTSFNGILRPGGFARIGIAHLNEDDGSATVPTVGLGFTLDLSLVPIFDFGAHAGYELVFGSDDLSSFDWFGLGLHAVAHF